MSNKGSKVRTDARRRGALERLVKHMKIEHSTKPTDQDLISHVKRHEVEKDSLDRSVGKI